MNKPNYCKLAVLGLALAGCYGFSDSPAREYIKNRQKNKVSEGIERIVKENKRIVQAKIIGSDAFAERISSAFDLIREYSPEDYKQVADSISEVRESSNETRIWPLEKICNIFIGDGEPLWFTAGTLVHEASHVQLYKHGEAMEGEEAERKCLEKQRTFQELLIKKGYESKRGEGIKPIDVEEKLRKRYWEKH